MNQKIIIQLLVVFLLVNISVGEIFRHKKNHHNRNHSDKDTETPSDYDKRCPSLHIPGTCEAVCSAEVPCPNGQICCPTSCDGTYCWNHAVGHNETESNVKISKAYQY
ncbi:hypothetical protein PPL_07046 [Heterostelium album PN500]|uniref:WAP domain-containing protein n=1 Tax=Heterostelium pallidum (strain ATCC 26659 / Pp 5 / PN500) TaxID=670386 RepID=D3BE90_HETP5|nr:hypothetical protein PPL_07046 [Heterostelium album PN500]EFA80221.1 hypothetical protein PPL_07046 [Heterostelium album PN500]|eukprot:XP_020432341.1 hypothetical protein PPL_07046 [Heterostelium album PN500]